MSHSPGPWSTDEEHIYASANSSGFEMCIAYAIQKNIKANAKLIAAAPDLLAACQALIQTDDLQRAIDLSRAAIAKASA